MQDIEDLIPLDSGWFELSPRDINDEGQIVGVGTFLGEGGGRHAFLMTPTPPIPAVSTWGLLVLTLLMLTAGASLIIRRSGKQPIAESNTSHTDAHACTHLIDKG